MRRARLALVTGLLLSVGGCAGGLYDPTPVPPTTVATAPATPSTSAKMVCEEEAQGDITEAVGIAAHRVEPPPGPITSTPAATTTRAGRS